MPADATEPHDEQHTITAIEAYWIETQLRYDADSLNNVTIAAESTVEKVEGTTHAWEYECTCGDTFPSYESARQHLIETAGTAGAGPQKQG